MECDDDRGSRVYVCPDGYRPRPSGSRHITEALVFSRDEARKMATPLAEEPRLG